MMNADFKSRVVGSHAAPAAHVAPAWHVLTLTLWQRRRYLVAGLVTGCVLAGVFYVMTPRMFRAEATLLVRYVADTTWLDPGATGGRVVSPDARGENIINSEIEILANRDSVEKVVDRVGPDNFPDAHPGPRQRILAIKHVLENLIVDAPRRSNIIRVTYDARTAELALQVLRDLVDTYLKKHLAVHRSGEAYDFLVQQTDQARMRLQETEEELQQMRAESSVGVTPASGEMLSRRIAEIRSQLGNAEAQLASATARMRLGSTGATRELPVMLTNLETNPSARGLRLTLSDRLTLLQQRENELSRIFTEESVPIQEIRGQIQRLMAVPSDEIQPAGEPAKSVPDMFVMPETIEVAGLEAQVLALREQLDIASKEAVHVDELKIRIDQLDRNREILEENYRMFSRSLEQARINEALDAGKISNISVVQPPLIIAANYRPGLPRTMAGSIAGCLGLSMVAAVMVELLPRWIALRPAGGHVPAAASATVSPG